LNLHHTLFSALFLQCFSPKCLSAASSALSCLCLEKASGSFLSPALFYSLDSCAFLFTHSSHIHASMKFPGLGHDCAHW
jgi:hypothetical protein